MKLKELFRPFENALDRPAEEVSRWKKERGGKAIGFLMTDVPEELIHAAGFFPYGIIGRNAQMEMAGAHLQPWSCSYVRSCLALALDGELDFLDGVIVPQICDTTRMLLDLWKHIRPFPYMDIFRIPRQVDRPSSGRYLVAELERIKLGLEELSGDPIGSEDLDQSIALFNENRALMRRMAEIHAQEPALLNDRTLYTIINGSMVMPREKVNLLLNEIMQALEGSLAEENGADDRQIRLIMSGTLLEPMEILDFINECGGTVVGDDFQNGYRYIEADVDTENPPLEALALRQIKRIPSAAFAIQKRQRRYYLAQMAGERKARGAIFLHLSFCEPENYDSHDNLEAMKEAGIQAMRVETQYGRAALGQLRNRVHAFMEMVGGESQ